MNETAIKIRLNDNKIFQLMSTTIIDQYTVENIKM